MNDHQKLRELAIEASKNSHSPYSNAQVGSAIQMESGQYFSGCNIENSSFGGTVCAERVAIFKAVSQNEKSISKIYVYTKAGWPPCGLCLQVMTEFSDNELEVIIGNEAGDEKKVLIKDLLPLAFTPDTYHTKE
ncbi:cytidine deaminase [Bacteriovoracales bacterium]|nr:cytidine deaminase [Bacteriovoracales bacterium]